MDRWGFVRQVCPLPGRKGSSVTGPPPPGGRVHVITHKRLGLHSGSSQVSEFLLQLDSSFPYYFQLQRKQSAFFYFVKHKSNYIPQNSTSKAHTWYLLFATRAHCSPFSGIPSILCNLSFLLPFFLFFLLKTKTQ